jgi:hypothetical protein
MIHLQYGLSRLFEAGHACLAPEFMGTLRILFNTIFPALEKHSG